MLNDLRDTLRSLLRSPSYAASACLVMALGIGVNVGVFAVADAALLRPLPYDEPERLVNLYQMVTTFAGERMDTRVRPPHIDTLRQMTHIFEAVEVVRFGRAAALDGGVDHLARIGGFSPGLPGMLGVQPLIGRGFAEEDLRDPAVAMISEDFWTRVYGRDPDVLGRTLEHQGRRYTIVGVAPGNFRYFAEANTDAWIPIGDDESTDAVARLRKGLTVTAAQRHVDEAVARLFTAGPKPEFWLRPADWRRTSPPGAERSAYTMLRAVVIAALLVFVVACANLANLVNERTITREREFATRLAVGAPRWRIASLILLETTIVAVLGGVIALITASWAVGSIPRLLPPGLVATLLAYSLPSVGWRVWLFGIAVAACAGLLLGTIAALRVTRRDVAAGNLWEARRSFPPGRFRRRVAQSTQAVQLAATLVLLIGTTLSLTSFSKLLTADDGFEPGGLLHVALSRPGADLTPGERTELSGLLVRQISALPGVAGASIGAAPVANGSSTGRWEPVGDPDAGAVLRFSRFVVGPGYFDVARMTLEQGRSFGREDTREAERVIIITRNAATRLWPAGSAIGERIRMSDGGEPYTVVGVVRDLKLVDMENSGVEMFIPAAQWGGPLEILVRFDRDPSHIAEAIRKVVADSGSGLRIDRLATVERLRRDVDPLGYSRILAALLAAFAVLGATTSLIGFYAVVSSDVTRRMREIATRVALGASTHRITWMFMSEVLLTLLGAVFVGLLAAKWLTGVIALRLFEVSLHAPVLWFGCAAVLAAGGAVVTWFPIRRAGRRSPADLLRVV